MPENGIDETMSQDTAFENFSNNERPEDTFQFLDEEKGSEETTPESQPKVEEEVDEVEESDSDETEDNKNVEDEPEVKDTEDSEQRVPYSRFKKQLDAVTEQSSKIEFLEEQLQAVQERQKETTTENVEVPEEWKKLYGDSDLSKDAYVVQLKREDKLRSEAVQEALAVINKQRNEESQRLVENEDLIEDNLMDLQDTIGKKLTNKQEESILQIVDEFSPTDDDGKYTSLFPFDKAYEIYTLRESTKGKGTRKARAKVADLTGNSSQGEVESGEAPHKRGWDNWRDEI